MLTRSQSARLRLLSQREQTEAVGVEMILEAGRFDAIAGAEPTRAVSAFQLFQTPEAVARNMAERLACEIGGDAPWLEPSAGLGRLYRAGRAAGLRGPCSLAEQAPDCARELYTLTESDPSATLKVGDFLTMNLGRFGGILMNPPFQRGTDVKHIRHAMGMLTPGGVLVGLCYDGVKQNRDLRPIVDEWEPLPAGAFRSEGTNAGVVQILIRNPH